MNLYTRTKKRKYKTILVTGGTGFIGKYVVDILSKNFDLRLLVKRKNPLKFNKNISIFVGDITDKKSVEKACEGVDCVVHLAAIIKGESGEKIYDVNVNGTKNLVEASIKNKVKKFVFLSSDYVLYTNNDAYGESKKECEKIVKNINNYVILRLTSVYGKGNKIDWGKIIKRVKNSNIIFIPGNGKALLQPIYALDVAQYVNNSILYDAGGTFNLAGSSKATLNALIDTICKACGKKVIKLRIPLFMIYFVVRILETFFSKPFLRVSQIKNINRNRVYNISNTIRMLKHRPLTFSEGIKLTVGH